MTEKKIEIEDDIEMIEKLEKLKNHFSGNIFIPMILMAFLCIFFCIKIIKPAIQENSQKTYITYIKNNYIKIFSSSYKIYLIEKKECKNKMMCDLLRYYNKTKDKDNEVNIEVEESYLIKALPNHTEILDIKEIGILHVSKEILDEIRKFKEFSSSYKNKANISLIFFLMMLMVSIGSVLFGLIYGFLKKQQCSSNKLSKAISFLSFNYLFKAEFVLDQYDLETMEIFLKNYPDFTPNKQLNPISSKLNIFYFLVEATNYLKKLIKEKEKIIKKKTNNQNKEKLNNVVQEINKRCKRPIVNKSDADKELGLVKQDIYEELFLLSCSSNKKHLKVGRDYKKTIKKIKSIDLEYSWDVIVKALLEEVEKQIIELVRPIENKDENKCQVDTINSIFKEIDDLLMNNALNKKG